MSAEPKKTTFPYVPAKTWWLLRKRFKLSWPTQVNRDYLQSVLGVGEGHAQNLLDDLEQVGLIDGDGKPTDLANDWRSDEHYAEICQRILESHYPTELRDAFPPPKPERDGVTRWFERNLRIGEKAADKLASFYSLLSKADVSAQEAPARQHAVRTPSSVTTSKRPAGAGSGKQKVTTEERVEASLPSLSLAVQVYISPESTPEQIDATFASMAKHLYRRG